MAQLCRSTVTWKGTNCGGEGSWMRVAHLNMTDPSSQCTADFTLELRLLTIPGSASETLAMLDVVP